MKTQARIVLVTHDDSAKAEALARSLVGEQLAACVNLIPGLRSIYAWKGAVHEDTEILMMIKTRESKLADLEAYVLEHHSYETPEFLVLPTEGGSEAYLAWLEAQTP